MRGARETGATMIELVISIVVIAIAVGAVLGLLSSSTAHSADAMVLSQAVSLSQAYIEEISLKPFADPDGRAAPTAKPIASISTTSTTTTASSTSERTTSSAIRSRRSPATRYR